MQGIGDMHWMACEVAVRRGRRQRSRSRVGDCCLLCHQIFPRL